jgi:hypothetical protein
MVFLVPRFPINCLMRWYVSLRASSSLYCDAIAVCLYLFTPTRRTRTRTDLPTTRSTPMHMICSCHYTGAFVLGRVYQQLGSSEPTFDYEKKITSKKAKRDAYQQKLLSFPVDDVQMNTLQRSHPVRVPESAIAQVESPDTAPYILV